MFHNTGGFFEQMYKKVGCQKNNFRYKKYWISIEDRTHKLY